jgi:hypothetical protein
MDKQTDSENLIATHDCRTNVRFTQVEYRRMLKDQLISGKSIPTLLKERYFKSSPFQPVISATDMKLLMAQLIPFNRNLNQLTRYMHSGIGGTILEDFQQVFRSVNELIENISMEYGNRKNTV